ncbi:MAG: cyclic nucleotide-binding domain-containing protein [Alphaproteobacteria bacterium]
MLSDRINEDLDPRKSLEGRNTKVLHREVFFKGKAIIEQGDTGNRAYFIERGRVEILIKDADGRHQLKVAEMGPGDLFGEMSLITNEPRSATVRAMEDCTVTVISRDEVEGKIRRIDDAAIRALISVLADRLRRSTQGQLNHYTTLANFQDRISGVVDSVDVGIDPKSRDAFRDEVTPLLNDLQKVLDRYQR